MALGNIIGDVVVRCGMRGGEIAARGRAIPGLSPTQVGILGDVVICGTIDRSSAIVSGGEIGDRALCTALSVDCDQGIIAAKGAVNFDRWSIPAPGSAFINVGSGSSTDPNAPLDAAAIDAIFTQGGQPLQFDMTPGDLAGLAGDREGSGCAVDRHQRQGAISGRVRPHEHDADPSRSAGEPSRLPLVSRPRVRPMIELS